MTTILRPPTERSLPPEARRRIRDELLGELSSRSTVQDRVVGWRPVAAAAATALAVAAAVTITVVLGDGAAEPVPVPPAGRPSTTMPSGPVPAPSSPSAAPWDDVVADCAAATNVPATGLVVLAAAADDAGQVALLGGPPGLVLCSQPVDGAPGPTGVLPAGEMGDFSIRLATTGGPYRTADGETGSSLVFGGEPVDPSAVSVTVAVAGRQPVRVPVTDGVFLVRILYPGESDVLLDVFLTAYDASGTIVGTIGAIE